MTTLSKDDSMNSLTAEELAYIAGLIDAECSMSVHKRQHKSINGSLYIGFSVTLDMTTTTPVLTEWLKSKVGGFTYHRPNPNIGWKQSYGWRLCGKETCKLLQKVRPYLVLKGERADVVIQFPFGRRRPDYIEQKESLWKTMREFNTRGQHLAATTEFKRRESVCDSLLS